MIGDTSDKDSERPMLTAEIVKQNHQKYFEQAGKIIDLDKTAEQLKEAISFLTSVHNAGKTILFVGVKPEVRQIVKEVALSLNSPYIAERFIGGSLTNFPQMKKRIEKLHDLLKKKEAGELSVYTKKEQLLIQRDIERLIS